MASRDGATSEEDERDWSEWGDDNDDEATKSLFSDTILPSAQQAIAFDAREHKFDVRQFRTQVRRCQRLCALRSILRQPRLLLNLIIVFLLSRITCPITTPSVA